MNIIDVLRLDINEIETEFRKIASVLEKIGLSEYESRLFVAAVIKGHGTADELAEISMVPRTSAYKALQSLEGKGMVVSAPGRPTVYHHKDLDELKRGIIDELDDTFDKLRTVRGLLSEKGTPELVYTIAGKKRVMAKIGEMLDSAKQSIVISSPKMKEIRAEHGQRFKDALKRGVKVIIICEPMVKVPEATEIYRKKDLLATDVISDARIAMMAAPELDLCGFSDNPFIAQHLEHFIISSVPKEG